MPPYDIEEFIPHRHPMRLIDEIVSVSGTEIVTKKHIRNDAFFLQGHYPDYPIVPGIITCEGMFQSGAALIGKTEQNNAQNRGRKPVVARIQNVKFKRPVFPEDEIYFVVRLDEKVGSAFYFSGEARVRDQIVASAQFTCTLS